MPLNLYTSNRLEKLSDALARSCSRPLTSPFTPETIVVQSRGMQRWISLELARRQGVAANLQFPFPNSFVRQLADAVVPADKAAGPDPSEPDPFEPEALTWTLMRILPGLLNRPEFGPLRHYLQAPRATLKRLQLSTRIADLFDQYLVYRPEMIFEWEKGAGENWQAILWRTLKQQVKGHHRAATGRLLIKALQDKTDPSTSLPRHLPERVAIFSISSLPDFHLHVFEALSTWCEVNLFLLNPCREFWEDIKSEKEIRHLAVPTGQSQDFDGLPGYEAFYYDEGNRLLASMGKLGREFFGRLETLNYNQIDCFEAPPEDTLLGALQLDILHLRDRGHQDELTFKVAADDVSLQLHSCHGERREVEVLQDALLDIFERTPDLKPSDILVMAPDIEPYAPFIEAVFGLPFDDPKRLPYTIADRGLTLESDVVETFFSILELSNSRFSAPEVLTLMESRWIQQRFGFDDESQNLIHTWVRGARIRWGIDADDRAARGLPAVAQNTWRHGLNRLLLGTALPARDDEMFHDIVPFDCLEGKQSETLGQFMHFVECLFALSEELHAPRSLSGWQKLLDGVLETFFMADDESVRELHLIKKTLATFQTCEALSGCVELLEFVVIRHHLRQILRDANYGFGFLSGGITFCSMLPMRSIPARVVCLLGMNNDAYPRSQRPVNFDLIARHPRAGDRSRRTDDRYLFLESLLSARDLFYISYIGQSIKDSSMIPASVLVAELLEYLETNYTFPRPASEFLIRRHRLQAFSPIYFEDSREEGEGRRLFSFSKENYAAAVQLSSRSTSSRDFLEGLLDPPGETFRDLSFDDLYRFFRNPVEYLFNTRLGVFLGEADVELEESESFSLGGLDRYGVGSTLVEKKLRREKESDFREAKLQSGELPHGTVGACEFDVLSQKADNFIAKTEPFLSGEQLAPLAVNTELAGFRLYGRLDPITANGLVLYRYAQVRAKDHLNAWLNHLILNCFRTTDYPATSLLIGLNHARKGVWRGWRFKAVDEAQRLLAELLQLYEEGLRRPLRFFPEAALAFVQTLNKNEGKDTSPGDNQHKALRAAAKSWFGSSYEGSSSFKESNNPYFYRCFGNEEMPLNDDFRTISRRVYEPLLEHQEEL